METNRQKKIAGVIQEDLAEVLQRMVSDSGHRNVIVSVSKVRVTVDLSLAKAYISVFPPKHAEALLEEVIAKSPVIKHELAQRTKHQFRRMPDLEFFNDDSLEYIDGIERSLKGEDNPIEHPELLDKRKKK